MDSYTDAEDSEGHESDWETEDSSIDSSTECSSSSHHSCESTDEEEQRHKSKRARLASQEYSKTAPHCILPIGMGSIFWQYFGFPVWSHGEFLTREFVKCSFCTTLFALDGPQVIPKLRAHLQKCDKDVYKVAAEECLKTPLIELNKIPNTLVTTTQGNRMWKWLLKRRDAQMESAPKKACGKLNRIQNALFMVAVENLRVGMMCEDSPLSGLMKQLLDIAKPDCGMPDMTRDKFTAMLSLKYEVAKAKVIAALKLCSEYSMAVEEWIDEEETTFITFSVNYVKDGNLKNSILLTVPKNLDELPLAFATLTNTFGINLNKVPALITNSDIPFADFWESETPTQFLPCFFESIKRAIKDNLFELPYVKALLEKIEFKAQPYGDLQVMLMRFEECLDERNFYELTVKEKALFEKVIRVLSSLRVAMDTIKLDHPTALISILWPMLNKLQTEFMVPELLKDDEQAIEMKRVLMDSLMDFYKRSLSFIQAATLIDPRFR